MIPPSNFAYLVKKLPNHLEVIHLDLDHLDLDEIRACRAYHRV